MTRFVATLLVLLTSIVAVRADENDGWSGEWVFPRSNGITMIDEAGKTIGKWSVSAGKVIWSGKSFIQIRHNQYPGPNEGYVKKDDVVKLADAPMFFTDKIRENEKSVWAWRCRAGAWTLKGEHENAIKDITEAIRLDPSAFVYTNRGLAWYAQKAYEKAIKDYTEAIRLDPTLAVPFNNRGNALYAQKEFEKAIKDYTEAIRLDPKWAPTFHFRGNALAWQKEYEKAMKDYDEAIRLDPKEVGAFYDKACCYSLQGKTDRALEVLKQTLELGYRDFKHMEKDTDLDSIRKDPRYKKLIEQYSKEAAKK